MLSLLASFPILSREVEGVEGTFKSMSQGLVNGYGSKKNSGKGPVNERAIGGRLNVVNEGDESQKAREPFITESVEKGRGSSVALYSRTEGKEDLLARDRLRLIMASAAVTGNWRREERGA